jgi:hypothetical protein
MGKLTTSLGGIVHSISCGIVTPISGEILHGML